MSFDVREDGSVEGKEGESLTPRYVLGVVSQKAREFWPHWWFKCIVFFIGVWVTGAIWPDLLKFVAGALIWASLIALVVSFASNYKMKYPNARRRSWQGFGLALGIFVVGSVTGVVEDPKPTEPIQPAAVPTPTPTPKSDAGLLALGVQRRMAKDFAGSNAALKDLLASFPDSRHAGKAREYISRNQKDQPAALYANALAFRADGKYDESNNAANKVIGAFPTSPFAWKAKTVLAQNNASLRAAAAAAREADPVNRFIKRLAKAGVGSELIDTVSYDSDPKWIKVTVANGWHLAPYQLRLQAAQNLWKLWAGIASPSEPDNARIKLVDYNDNEVGGSRVIAGSMIWVQEN